MLNIGDDATPPVTDRLIAEATSALDRRTVDRLHLLIEHLHPADLAELVRRLDEPHRLAFMLLLDEERAAAVLEHLEPEEQVSLVRTLTDEQITDLLEEMATDEVVDLLGELPATRVQRLLRLMGAEEARRIQELLEFPEGTAGALMTTELVTVPVDLTAAQAIEAVRQRGRDAGILYYLYVEEGSRLVGVVSLRALIVAPSGAPLREIMKTRPLSVSPWTPREKVAEIAEKYDLFAVPVTDAAGRILGVVTGDDILEVVGEEASEDVFELTGPVEEEMLGPGPFPWPAARRRTFWMVLNFGTALAAAAVIRLFAPVLETFIVLIFFMPVVMATAGNVGTQSLALTVRRLSAGREDAPEARRALVRELGTGGRIGLAAGALLAVIVLVWQRDPLLSAVLFLAMLVALSVAASSGVLIPVVLRRFRVDPAVASGPLVTTITDLVSVSIYFALASALLKAR